MCGPKTREQKVDIRQVSTGRGQGRPTSAALEGWPQPHRCGSQADTHSVSREQHPMFVTGQAAQASWPRHPPDGPMMTLCGPHPCFGQAGG